MNKVKLVEVLDFTCKECKKTVRSYVPKSIESKVCISCREDKAGRKLTAFE